MAEVFLHLKPFAKRALSWVDDLIHEATTKRDRAEREINFLKELRVMFAACPECGGRGETRTIVAHDESRYAACGRCGGSGSLRGEG